MTQKRRKYWFASWLLLAAGLVSCFPVGRAAAVDATCHKQTVGVKLSADSTTTYNVVGWLCWQGSLSGKAVQFIQPGATYDHNYWDWPQDPALYSYVHDATTFGYAAFTIDRLGVGESDHPADPNAVTAPAEAFVASQIVQDLRHGSIGGHQFSQVIGVGHSLGSGITMLEASTYHDVDGIILTGLLHQINPESFTSFGAAAYPAVQDPKFANSGLAPGYLTTRPGTRAGLFYNTSFADPSVIALDEQLKQTTTTGEFSSLGAALDPSVSLAIHVPVLLVVGQQDFIFCNESQGLSCANTGAVQAREAADYAPQACLEAYVLPESGHDINLHPDAQAAYAVMTSWSYRRVGNGIVPPLQPCNLH